MHPPDPAWTEILQTIFIGLQLAVLTAAAGFGWRQLAEAKELREERTRPFVVIDLDPARPTLFDLVVRNTGATIAREVRFKFDPALESTMEHASADRLKMFREGISTLPPGKEIRTLFDSGPARHSARLPDVYEVTITYRGRTGDRLYTETVDIDFGLYWNRMYVTVHDVHDLHKEIEGIHREIRKWTASYGGGLLHVTSQDIQRRIEDIERQMNEQAAPEDPSSQA